MAKKAKKRVPGMYRYIYGVLITGFDGYQRLSFDVFQYRRDAVNHARHLRFVQAAKGAKAVKLIATMAKAYV